MPQLLTAIGYFFIGLGAPTWLATGLTLALAAGAVIGASYGLGKLLQPNIPRDLSAQQSFTISNVLDPAPPREYVIGENRTGGVIIFRESTPDAAGQENFVFNQVICLGYAPSGPRLFDPLYALTSLGTIYFGDYPIPNTAVDTPIDPITTLPGDDTFQKVVVQGRYGSQTTGVLGNGQGWVFLEKDRGPNFYHTGPYISLRNLSDRWTDDCYGHGVASLYSAFYYGAGRFPNGIPEISVRVRGMELLDPREVGYPASSRVYSNNPALVIAWYLTLPIDDDGWGVSFDDLDVDSFASAANVCDEIVDTNQIIQTVTYSASQNRKQVSTDEDWVLLDLIDDGYQPCKFVTGDRVEVAAISGSLPTGLSAATEYYIIVRENKPADAEGKLLYDNGTYGEGDFLCKVRFSTSYADAITETSNIDITAVSDCQFQVIKTGEPRYTYDNIIRTDRDKREILNEHAGADGRDVGAAGGRIRDSDDYVHGRRRNNGHRHRDKHDIDRAVQSNIGTVCISCNWRQRIELSVGQ